MEEPSVEINAMKQKIAEEYLSSLADLNVNSKPLINMLTILAEENMDHADVIIKVVEQHISKVDAEIKLPVLYLIDSIVKNVGGQYIQLFSQCIVNIFVGVFDKVKENVREKMYALRQTWVEVFPPQKLYTLDVKVKCIDQNWPITAKVPTPAIHVNPKFLTKETNDPSDMQAKLLAKQRELLELQNRKLEMELEATKLRLKHQEQRLQSERPVVGPTAPAPQGINNSEISTESTAIPSSQVNVHVNKNYPFNQVRTNMRKSPNLNNTQGNFSTSANSVANRPRIAPVNSAMLSTLSRRDPRLVRQQQQQQQLHNKQEQTLNNNSKNTDILISNTKLDLGKTFEAQKIRNEEDIITSFGKKRSEDRSLDEQSGNKGSRLKGTTNSPSKDRRSPVTKDFKNSKVNEKSKSSSNRNDRSDRQRDKDRHRDKDKKYSDKKFKDSDNEKGKAKEEKCSKDNNSGSLHIGEAPTPPKLSELSFHNRKRSPTRNNHKSSPPKDIKPKEIKSRNKSPSPNNDKTKLDKEMPEKRIKLTTINPIAITTNCSSTATLSSTLPTLSAETSTTTSTNSSNINKDKMSKIAKLEQNKDEGVTITPQNTSKDVDLRKISKMDIDINAIDEIDIIDNFKKSDEIVNNNIDKTIEIRPNITKKRTSSDEFILGEPTIKKSKVEEIDQKIDILFGTEDVDLRKLPTHEVSPPPPPMISNENESWAKVKGVKPGISSEKLTGKSSLDDVRAKLAKAAKNNNYSFGKGIKKQIKKPIVEEFNEDSQDGAADSIRTIISQAQELLESKGISSEQYNTLVKTAMQINETNKLKEAQRRESLTLQHDKENKNEDPKSTFANISPKEQRKKLPKIPKTTDSKQNNNSESKQLEFKKSELSHEFNDVPVKRSNSPMEKLDEKDKEVQNNTTTRRRRSKWSSMTPWEIQQQKQQNWMLQQQQQQQQASSVPPPPFPPKLLAIPPVPGAGLQGPHNQWQNPPSIIFGGNAIQPIAAASITNLNNAPLINSGNISGPAFSNSVNNPQDDIVRTIPIDGVSKEIRIYDDVAIVFMDWDQPREIGFQNGQRRIIIDNQDPIALNFNDDFVNITITGSIHRIKYGFPSRELYIDANWYECYFGGPPLTIPLDGKFHVLQIEGPPPQVHIGPIRQDLVVGKINLVIDAHVVIPVFLDSRPQSFELYNKKHIIQFTDSLSTALIDNEPMEVEYGGLPKSFNLNGEKHFIRFTTLPSGIIPGRVNIKNMICTKIKENFLVEDAKQDIDIKSVPIPPIIPSLTSIVAPPIALNVLPATIESVPNASDVPISTNLLNVNQNNITPIEAANGIPSLPGTNQTTTTIPAEPATSSIPPVSSVLPPSINIDELFQKLLASGILNNQSKDEEKKKEEEEQEKEAFKITSVDLKKSESIKTRQSGIVNTLFSGMQCSSCGLRFPPEQTMKYSQHLDWHFRQNRRERDSNRKAHSRKWYYDLSDWLQYEEIEDLEDREKNWFETQQVELETDENSNQKCISPQPSCSAEAEDVDRGCEICLEKFEHFYNEELEEWHLKSAIKVDNAFYHPICYKDLQEAIVKEAKENEEAKVKEKDDVKEKEETECIEIDDSVIIIKQERSDGSDGKQIEDDDDDVIVLPNEEPSITEIPDDDDYEIFSPPVKEIIEQHGEEESISNEEKSSQIEKSSTNSDTLVLSNQKESNEKTSVNASIEDDIVIEEPQIPFQDLDTYVEKDLSHLNEDSTQSSFANIKIKEEPKDDDEDELIEEDDVFEDVGTVEINDSLDSPLATCIVEVEEETDADKDLNAVLDNDASSSVNVSIDGNVRINNVPSQKLGVNKIVINIAKNIVNSSNNSNLNNNSSNINSNENNIDSDINKVDKTENQQQIQQQISTIPVITTNQNFNRREFNVYNNNSSSSTVSQNSTTTTVTTTSTTVNTSSSNNNNNNSNNNVSSSQTIPLNKPNSSTVIASLLSNSTTLISIPTTDIESTAISKQTKDEEDQNENEPPKIEFKYKSELQNVEFKTVEKLEKGYETSGLCSIM